MANPFLLAPSKSDKGVTSMATLAYFTVPKALDQPPYSKILSVQARYLYGRLRDTHKLSARNGWRDEMGIYVKMARKTIAELFEISLPTCRKLIAELLRAGLILEKRVGLTRCNHIYVQPLPGETEDDLLPKPKNVKGCKAQTMPKGSPDSQTAPEASDPMTAQNDPSSFPSTSEEPPPSAKKPYFTPERKPFSVNKRNPNERKPNEPQKTKNGHFWVFREGDIFTQDGTLWQFTEGEVHPYYTKADLRRLMREVFPCAAV